MAAAIKRVIQPVTDIERATTFYGRVLHQPGRRVSEDVHEFSCGDVMLECRLVPAVVPHGGAICFTVPDLDNHHGRTATSGCRGIGRIEEGPGGRSFIADDPFGNRLCFIERS